MIKIKRKTINNLVYLLKRQPRLLVIFTVIITISSLLEALGIGILYPIVNILENSTKRLTYINKIHDLLNIQLGENQFLIFLFVGAVVLFLIRVVSIVISYYSQYKLSEYIRTGLQIDIFNSYLTQKYDFFIQNKAGDLIQKQMVHTENAANAVVYTCQIARNFLSVIFLYGMLCLISIKGTLLLTGFAAVCTLAVIVISKIMIYEASKEHARLQKEAYSIVSEVISGIRQVKSFLAENFFKKHFLNVATERARIYTKNATIGQMPTPILQTIVLIGIFVVLFFVIQSKENIKSLLPAIIVFVGGSYRIISLMGGINSSFMQIAHLFPSVNIVCEILYLEHEDKKFPEADRFNKDIVFENVSFSYLRDGFSLSDVNAAFCKGKFYGIVGASGSGKSTLVDLIVGFYFNDKGRILIDGKDVREIDMDSWRRQVGIISQETFIFNGTIEENISFAVDSSDVEKDKVIMAAKTADMHDHIMSLPEGYQTMVGERGLKLSGGQRQRLAIARAVYRDPEIYIFDEATSSLDTYSEKKIQQAIESLSRSKTVIAIAHRLSTVRNADEILVIDGGKVIEKGKHQELISNDGVYAGLCSHQQDIQDNEREKDIPAL